MPELTISQKKKLLSSTSASTRTSSIKQNALDVAVAGGERLPANSHYTSDNSSVKSALTRVRSSGSVPPPKLGVTPPTAPTITSVLAGSTVIDIYFTEPTNNGGAPVIDYYISLNGGSSFVSSRGNITSPFHITGLVNGYTYNVALCAVNHAGPSRLSNIVDVTPSQPPSAPTNLTVVPGDGQIEVSFDEGDQGTYPLTNYQYSINGGTSWSPITPAKNTSPVTITTGLVNGTIYQVKLRAITAHAISPASSQTISVAPIPASFTPTSIGNLNSWLDAQNASTVIMSAGKVAGWIDQSTEGSNYQAGPTGTITYDGTANINGRPVLNFTTGTPTSTYLVRDNYNIAQNNELTLFMVVSQTSVGSGNSELFFTRDDYRYFDIFSNTNPGNNGMLSFNCGNTTQYSTGVDIITNPPSVALIEFVLSTTVTNVYINGTHTNIDVPRGPLSLDNNLNWAISGGAFKGYIGELATYQSVFSNSDREKMEGYLAWKWGIQTQLPTGHPYKLSPPSS